MEIVKSMNYQNNAEGIAQFGVACGQGTEFGEYHQNRTVNALKAQLKYANLVQQQIRNGAQRDWLFSSLEWIYQAL